MRSLRTRLVVGVVVLVGAALVLASVVTLAALRSYLFAQVDDQLDRAAVFPVALLRGERPVQQPAPPLPGGPVDQVAPTAVFVELRDAGGATMATFPIRVGDKEEPPPDLPATAGAAPGPSRSTVAAVDGSFRYRVLTVGVPGRGTAVVAASLQDVDATLRRLVAVEVTAGLAVLVLVGLLAAWLARLGLRPLDHMAETAGAIAAGDLSQRVAETDPRTEVGRLGLSFNAMIDQIEGAFAERTAADLRLRRFVADASHELRTPLTSIRGYAELYRTGAVSDRADLDRAMARVEAEALRMGVLVEDLLALARLDQGRPFDRVPVALGEVLRDAVDDAHAVEPDRPVDVQADDELTVLGERGALQQVVANLLANAREHTPRGTPVHVRLRAAGPEAVVEVADEGPGMAPEVADHVFDRFYRADPSRTRASGGSGLGLAIVAAIVDAHDGRISVDSAPGRGATFRVTLPQAPR